jgi:transcriptional regulator with XRE-family HTH domain
MIRRLVSHDVGVTTVAEFLRARREQLQPGDVGLPDSGRRRAPGLRREEVATLAGVSIDYLIRLEQGRDTRPSPSVIAALADALRLDDDQRRQLYTLAMMSHSGELCPATRPLTRELAPTVRLLLERLGTTPAFVVGPANDVLAWNDAWGHLVRPLGMLEGTVPNLARHVFLHPSARTVYPDWMAAADEQVSRLRAATGRWGDDESFAALMDELRTAPDFIERWSVFATTEKRRGTTRIVCPDIGRLRLNYEVLLLPDDVDEQRLITWLPADDATAVPSPAPATRLFLRVPPNSASSAEATRARRRRPAAHRIHDDGADFYVNGTYLDIDPRPPARCCRLGPRWARPVSSMRSSSSQDAPSGALFHHSAATSRSFPRGSAQALCTRSARLARSALRSTRPTSSSPSKNGSTE